MSNKTDIARLNEKRERRAARLAARTQSGPPFRASSEITGLPNHEYGAVTKTVKRRGHETRRFDVLAHFPEKCQRCWTESELGSSPKF